MKFSSASLAGLLMLAPLEALAKKKAPELADYCFYSIYTTLDSYTFYDSSTTSSSKTAYCTDTIYVTSLYASAKLYCNTQQWTATIPYWKSLCKKSKTALMDLTTIEVNVTTAYATSLPAIDPETSPTKTTGTIKSPVRLTESYYHRALRTYVQKDYAIDKNIKFGWGLMGFWGFILVIGMIDKAWYTLVTLRRDSKLKKADIEGTSSSSRSTTPGVWHRVRTHLIIPAGLAPLAQHHQRKVLWHTIPRRLDLIIVSSWWVLTIIVSCVDYQSFSGDISMPSLFHQNWKYVAKRTPILSFACLPFLWLFGIRNNPFIWATRFSARSFNIFHRHVAVVCTLEAFVHAVTYSIVYIYYDDTYSENWAEAYWRWGVVALILMCCLVASSHSWLRTKSYEIFLITHVVFAILTIYSLFYHMYKQGTKYNYYLWPIVAIWSFERAVRLVRQAYCNLRVKFDKGLIRTKSTISYDESADLVRIELTPAASFSSLFYSPAPGQIYYLYQPFTIKGWENHPFTLGAYIKGASPNSPDAQPGDKTSDKLIFYIRPYDGWTRQVRDNCRKATEKGGVIHPSLIVEGPYGHGLPLHHFDTQLLIVGGTGIASAVPYIQDYMERASKGTGMKTTKVQLVWSGKQEALFESIMRSEELRGILGRRDIQLSFFCTGAPRVDNSTADAVKLDRDTTGGEDGDKLDPAVTSLPYDSEKTGAITPSSQDILDLNIQHGRPDVRSIVASASEDASTSSSSLAVLTCGPAQMADDSRSAVHAVMRGGFHNVEYFEETFGW